MLHIDVRRIDEYLRAMPRRTIGACERQAQTLPEPDLSSHAALFRALGDEGRLRIVARLSTSSGPMCVCDLMAGIELSQPTVSHHLKVLKEAGVVRSERRGTWVYYTLELSVIGALGQVIAALAPAPANLASANAQGCC